MFLLNMLEATVCFKIPHFDEWLDLEKFYSIVKMEQLFTNKGSRNPQRIFWTGPMFFKSHLQLNKYSFEPVFQIEQILLVYWRGSYGFPFVPET